MLLSANFTVEEYTRNSHKVLQALNESLYSDAKLLFDKVVQPVRERLNMPIRISSGYRNEKLNNIVKGSKTSQHRTAQAVDLQCDDNAKLFRYIIQNGEFDQLIWERGTSSQPAWVHVSYNRFYNRNQILIK